ncbi:MAG: DUF3540 domain-containing protein [Rhodocyclaceae bacterium]|nr:DUF3540 domain-containing protein [Rhodocyclaceae bacterium]
MNHTENAQVTEGIIQQVGEVEKSGEAGVMVSTPQGIVRARLAFSCLVQPACGDIVLLSRRETDCYVLSILERHSDAPVEMRVGRSLAIEVEGDASLRARGTAEFGGDSGAALKGDSVAVVGREVEISGERVNLIGKALHWFADSIDTTARMIRQVSDAFSLRARSHARQVEDMELVRVGHLDLRADKILNMNAEHAIVKSRELVKFDGKQIQVG